MVIKKRSHLLIGIALLSALLIGTFSFSLVSAHQASGPRTWNAVVGIESTDHAVQGMSFLPTQLWVNVGDTITWTFKSGEPHTVTFLPPGEQLPHITDLSQAKPAGGTNYDGVSYYNSGVMSSSSASGHPATYSLTFEKSGDFIYYCLLHPSMLGIVHVQPAGTNYPFTQEDYNRQIQDQTRTALEDGRSLAGEAAQLSSDHHIVVGIADGLVGLMRFYPQNITIHVGETIMFMNHDPMGPHTVTFGPEQPNLAKPYGNPQAYDGTSPLNSGYLGMDWPQGDSFSVKFVKAGTFPFDCALHDQLGMKGVVTVLP